jgi:hypothetical protein
MNSLTVALTTRLLQTLIRRADVLDHFGCGEVHARHLAPVSFFRSSLIRDCEPSPWAR